MRVEYTLIAMNLVRTIIRMITKLCTTLIEWIAGEHFPKLTEHYTSTDCKQSLVTLDPYQWYTRDWHPICYQNVIHTQQIQKNSWTFISCINAFQCRSRQNNCRIKYRSRKAMPRSIVLRSAKIAWGKSADFSIFRLICIGNRVDFL